MTRRRGLRLCLADAINNTLRVGHKVTLPNAQRYCDSGVRSLFNIRRSAAIAGDDWAVAIQLVQMYRAAHTITEIYGNVDPSHDRRIRDWFLYQDAKGTTSK